MSSPTNLSAATRQTISGGVEYGDLRTDGWWPNHDFGRAIILQARSNRIPKPAQASVPGSGAAT